MKPTKMYLYYYFDMHEFIYEVDKDEVVERFGEEPEYDADFNNFEDDKKWITLRKEIEKQLEKQTKFEIKEGV